MALNCLNFRNNYFIILCEIKKNFKLPLIETMKTTKNVTGSKYVVNQ